MNFHYTSGDIANTSRMTPVPYLDGAPALLPLYIPYASRHIFRTTCKRHQAFHVLLTDATRSQLFPIGRTKSKMRK